jgi:protease I
VISLRNAFILLLIVVLVYSCSNSGIEKIDLEALPDLNGKSVVMIIASRDFRDEELREPESILEQKGAQVTIACSALTEAKGMKGMKVKPDISLDQVNVEDYDAVVFIGGSGAEEYWNDSKAHNIARETIAADKVLGAICIAPVTLANAGVLNGKKATVYFSEKGKLKAAGADYTGADVQVDGKIITANGPGAAARFGEAVARALGES